MGETPSTPPCACQTRPSSAQGARPAGGEGREGGGAQKSVPPSLRHAELEQAGHCPSPRPFPGTSGGEPGAVPSASVLEGRERAGTSASLKPRARLSVPPLGAPAGHPPHQPCPAPPFLRRSTPVHPSGGPERPTRPTCLACRGGALTCALLGYGVMEPCAFVSVMPCKAGGPEYGWIPGTSFLLGPSPCTLGGHMASEPAFRHTSP